MMRVAGRGREHGADEPGGCSTEQWSRVLHFSLHEGGPAVTSRSEVNGTSGELQLELGYELGLGDHVGQRRGDAAAGGCG